MKHRKFIKINSIITLVAFVLSIFAANITLAVSPAAAAENGVTEGVWNVKNPKGEFTVEGTGGYEKWGDGQQRFVVRDALGHLLSWGEAKIDKATNGMVKVSVKDVDGLMEATKIAAPAEAVSKAASLVEAPAAEAVVAAPAAPKTSIGQKLSALKDKALTPIEGAGKGSDPWNKGYSVGSEGPGKIVNKIKSIFHKNSAPAVPEAPAAPAAGTSPAAPVAPASPAAPAAPAAGNTSAQAPAAPEVPAAPAAPKTTIGQKLSALKDKITTPIEGTGKGSEAWDKGYKVGSEGPGKVVDKVKNIFSKKADAPAAPATPEAPAAPAAPKAADVKASAEPAAAPAAKTDVAAAKPAVDAPEAPAAPKATIGQKLAALKDKATTPIEGAGKGSEAWDKGFKVGSEGPGKVVDKVKSVFSKGDNAAAPAEAPVAADAKPAGTKAVADAPDAPAAKAAPATTDKVAVDAPDAPAAPAAKTSIGQKLSALKEKATTPIEGAGKGSEAWEKGFKVGSEGPGKVVDKVKSIFKRGDKTPSQELSDPANGKVEFNEKTGQFEKAPKGAEEKAVVEEKSAAGDKVAIEEKAAAPAAPSKMSNALAAGKDTLKASFSVKNLALSAGLTVGFKIFEQVKNGEKVSIGKAVGYLATGEFAGSFVGSGLGSAAGAVVGSLVGSTIPVVGPLLGALMPAIFGQVGGQIGSSLGNDLATGQKPSFRKALASIDKVAVLGQAIGSTIGASIGSMIFPGIGTMIGGLVGGMIGNLIVNKIRNRSNKIVAVNAANHQLIFSEQVAPPPAQAPAISGSISSGGGAGDAQGLYSRMLAAYQQYSQMLSEGRGDTPEGQSALAQYKQLYTSYAESMGAQK